MSRAAQGASCFPRVSDDNLNALYQQQGFECKLLGIQKAVLCLPKSSASRLVSVSVSMYVCILVHISMHTRILKLKLKATFWEILGMFVKIYAKGKPSSSFSTGKICSMS